MERHFNFLGQILLPENAFSHLGVKSFPTKLQFWQKKGFEDSMKKMPYRTEADFSLAADFDIQKEAGRTYEKCIAFARSALEDRKSVV